MKMLIILVWVLAMSVGTLMGLQAVKETNTATTKAQPKTQVQPTPTVFDGVVVVLKKQLSEIEKSKADQKSIQAKSEKEAAALAGKSDSIYTASKATLKSIYDKELEKIAVQEQTMKMAKDKLEQDYQGALNAIDEVRGVKR